MLELIHSGTNNIVCTQPFGCLPNHIVGKGMIRRLKDDYPWSNIVAIDYDPGATKINQENRIKLMLANARGLAAEEAKHHEAPHPELTAV
jgi:predicted nucleotide-binding protein (sugar kinase/HSP70/actin superfamily)